MIILLDDAYRTGCGDRFAGHDVRFFPSSITDPRELGRQMRPAEVIGFRRVLPFPFTHDLVSGAADLGFIHRSGSGADWFDVPYLSRLGILVAVNSGFNAPSVAEHTVLLTLLCLRRPLDYIESMRNGAWMRDLDGPPVMMLGGKTVGVIGVGEVGSRVISAMIGLGARVLCAQRDDSVRLPEGALWSDLDTIIAEADVLSLHVPLQPETRGLIGAREFARMKSDAVLINTSRGSVVDQTALVAALESGRIRGAGLDVFEDEPLPPDHVLRRMPNVYCTPHVGGAGIEIVGRQVEGTLANIDRYVRGLRPERLVNPGILEDGTARARLLQ